MLVKEPWMTNGRTIPFIFIAAQSYSGSTLLSFLLSTHPEIATIGEMTGVIASEDMDEYRCSCGNIISACSFWRTIAAKMAGKGFEFEVANFDTRYELGTHPWVRRLRTGSLRSNQLEAVRGSVFQLWPGQSDQLRGIGARNQALVESVLEVTGKTVFLDASKHHMQIRYHLKYTDLDLKVIHMVRDVRGVVNSALKYNTKLPARTAAQRWVKGNMNIERQLRALPEDRFLRIRYEDLCREIPQTLERLHCFCGVEPGLFAEDFRSSPHHIVGNKMRLSDSSEIKLDERWKMTLTAQQLSEVSEVAETLQGVYGYD
jgi:hypothetical protein